ncbi:MAG: polysaccharide deacetylase family protein [Planctomycetota bacterium]
MNRTPAQKPIASLSLDLDNKWAYLKTKGDSAWQDYPGYFEVAIPRMLEFLEQMKLTITFFVVGQDCALRENHGPIREIAEAGHEIANHSFHHEPWLHLYTPEKLEEEFKRSEEAIFEVTGKKPVGFRGPGFSIADTVLKKLIQRGYEYDCTAFPTFIGPLARAYYFVSAGSELSGREKESRKALFGRFSDGFQTLRPFKWKSGSETLLELPITTMPFSRAPIHASYLLYLSGISRRLARLYFKKAMFMCSMTGITPSMLLHPLDFLGSEDAPDLGFLPAMDQPAITKIELLQECLSMMTSRFDVGTMKRHADAVREKTTASRSIDQAIKGVSAEAIPVTPSAS